MPNLVRKLRNYFLIWQKTLIVENAGYDLWTHLPSYKAAVAAHGDYAVEHKPSVADIMIEAAMFLSDKMEVDADMTPDKEEWYSCPCGEEH